MRYFLISILSVLSLMNVVLLFWLIPAISVDGYSARQSEISDSLKAALQLGRLDLAVIILSGVALLIVMSGAFGYIKVEQMAEREAKEEARKRVDELLPEMVPELVAKHMELIATNSGDNVALNVDPEDGNG